MASDLQPSLYTYLFAWRLCSYSHQEVGSVFPAFEAELDLQLALANRMKQSEVGQVLARTQEA